MTFRIRPAVLLTLLVSVNVLSSAYAQGEASAQSPAKAAVVTASALPQYPAHGQAQGPLGQSSSPVQSTAAKTLSSTDVDTSDASCH